MRSAAVAKASRGSQVVRTKSLPAPTGGLNTRDNIAAMDERDAVILDNWFPQPSQVDLRNGYINWATGISGPVETVMGYKSLTTSKLFAANSSSIYDVTASGAVGAAVQSGLTNGRWQHVNFSTGSGTTYLYAVNGADKPRIYDGATWVAVDGVSTPAITGVTTTTLIHVNAFKTRLWFVQANTMKVWYLPSNSIGGAANSLDFGAIFTRGGSLMAMGTWTLDAGSGMDDYAVFITTEGEIAVYQGTDPSSATTFALKGVYYIGAPIGRRCYVKYGGDLLVICKDGLMPLSKALMSSRVNTKSALTDKIQRSMSEATTAYGSTFGWEIEIFPTENMLLLNVPVSVGQQIQYVMNTISGSWCRFTGWLANCFEVFNDELYFGGSGVVAKAWSGTSDNGANIVGSALPAFSYFGSISKLKNWRMARPLISSNASPGVVLGLNTDFDLAAPTGIPTFSTVTTSLWDAAIWDTALWGGGDQIKKDWQSVYGLGYCAALYLMVSSNSASCTWSATDYVFEDGGIL